MLDQWSTQRARRGRLRAVLAMHVPNPSMRTPWRFACTSISSSFFSTRQKEKCLLVLASP